MNCRGERPELGKPSETISIIQMSIDEAQGEAGVERGWVRLGEDMGDTVEGKQTVFTKGEGEGGLISWEDGEVDVPWSC